MRLEDIEQLKTPYLRAGADKTARFASAIKADVPKAALLANSILGDLDQQSFGIRWWKGISKHHSILIGDYLYQCASSIQTNMVEARLHFLELLDAWEKIDQRLANSVSLTPRGSLSVKHPPSQAPIDELPNAFEGLHLGGFFRAIGSALDCLGAAIAGVIGLPIYLRKAGISEVRTKLLALKAGRKSIPSFQIEFRDFFKELVEQSGPSDWMLWTLQYRHMLVHRGRRRIWKGLLSRDVVLLDANGEPIPRSQAVTHLTISPDESDVEAMVKAKRIAVLNERAEDTLSGVFASCREVANNSCEHLISIWNLRKSQPDLLHQPLHQWEGMPRDNKFKGYLPDSIIVDPVRISGHSIEWHRIQAAALLDKDRHLWNDLKPLKR